MPESIPRHIGQRLRDARLTKGWSLADVQAMTGAEFKSSALGAYERGDRIIPSDRLVELAVAYEVPVCDLLPVTSVNAGPEPDMDGTVSTQGLMDLVGCSFRQIDYWCRTGLIETHGGPTRGSGHARRFTPREVFVARVVQTLGSFGFEGEPLAVAVDNIRGHSPAARLVYIQPDGTTHWGPGDIAAIVIDLDQLRNPSDGQFARVAS